MQTFRRCSMGVWDTTVPGIEFDENGVSNYAKMFIDYGSRYPRGEEGDRIWNDYVSKMRVNGKSKSYDCLVGVSGGTDSSYLLHILKTKYNLRPLAVTFDNGWSSDIAVRNIKKMTDALKIDLETYVVDYEEMKDVLLSYMKAGLPWIDFPTDNAIKSVLYNTANREGIKHILIGHDFRSEGTQPNEWTYGDSKQIKYIQRKFGSIPLNSLPNISILRHAWLSYVIGIKMVYPYFFIDYRKKEAQTFLKEQYGWQYYGGHHHENSFTRFAIAHWMKDKFNIDKRIITLSAQVISGEISREMALEQLTSEPYVVSEKDAELEFVAKKLGITMAEFWDLWDATNKSYLDYPSHHKLMERFITILYPVARLILPQMPSYFLQVKMRKQSAK